MSILLSLNLRGLLQSLLLRWTLINIYWVYKEPTVLITVTLGLCYVLPSFSSKSTHHLLQKESSPPRAAPGRVWQALGHTILAFCVHLYFSSKCTMLWHLACTPVSSIPSAEHGQGLVTCFCASFILNRTWCVNKWVSEQPGWNSTLDKTGKKSEQAKEQVEGLFGFLGGFPDLVHLTSYQDNKEMFPITQFSKGPRHSY